MASHNCAARDGETSAQRHAREGRNADHARHCQEEANAALANAAKGDPANVGGNPRPIVCNLDQEFFHVGDQKVEQTLSANLAVAAHELDRLPQMPEDAKVRALLRVAQVQVDQIHNDQAPSHSMLAVLKSYF